jgi:hypothetical protein
MMPTRPAWGRLEAAQYTPGDEMHELALEEFDMARKSKIRDLQNPHFMTIMASGLHFLLLRNI